MNSTITGLRVLSPAELPLVGGAGTPAAAVAAQHSIAMVQGSVTADYDDGNWCGNGLIIPHKLEPGALTSGSPYSVA